MVRVEVGKNVEYRVLENVLRKAAEEMGWTARVEDRFNRLYRLGSIMQDKEYDHTVVRLKNMFRLPAARIHIYGKNESSGFYIRGLPFGFASNKKVVRYLDAVSRNLKQA